MIGKDKLDYQSLIVSYFKNKGDTHLTLKVFQYTSKAFVEFHTSELNNLKIYNGVQPMFLDINGDMKTDMIFTGKDAKGNFETQIAMGQSFDSQNFKIEPLSNYFLTSKEDKTCLDPNPNDMISNPHSNSYLDLNGDCIPDIFMTKVSLDDAKNKFYYGEIYLQKMVNGKNKYCLS